MSWFRTKGLDEILAVFNTIITDLEDFAQRQHQHVENKNQEIKDLQTEVVQHINLRDKATVIKDKIEALL